MGSLSPSLSLSVIVIGAGISGLSSAIALRRAGHNITIYESHPKNASAGAGIVVCPNAVRVLRDWDLHPEQYGMHPYKEGLIVDGVTLEAIRMVYGEGVLRAGGKPAGGVEQYMSTREDLRRMLRDEVDREEEEKGGRGLGRVKCVYERQVVGYDAVGERPAVIFGDGTRGEADLVLACDGIKSKAARIVVGDEGLSTPVPMGFSAFRLLVDADKLESVREKWKDNPTIRSKFDYETGQVWFSAGHPGNGQTGKLIVWWQCGGGKVHAFDVLIPDNDERFMAKEEWLAHCEKQVLLDEFAAFHPLFRDCFAAADPPLLWKIFQREPLETMYRGGLVLMGDALHPMPPYKAQGGSQTIEDAGALEICLSGMRDKSELPQRLELLQTSRVPRYGCAQWASTVRQDEANFEERHQEVFEHCRKWFAEEDQDQFRSRDVYQGWFTRYDVRAEAKKALNRLDR